jgi:seryl-tRNA synthetase
MMLDKKNLLNICKIFEESCQKRNIKSNYDEFLKLNQSFKEVAQRLMALRTEQNTIKNRTQTAIELKQKIAQLNHQKEDAEAALNAWLLNQPNMLLSDVPAGKDEKENQIIFSTQIPEKITRPHYEIIDSLIMKSEAATISGSRFVIFKSALSQLKNALVNFMLEHNRQRGYEEYTIPYLVTEQSFYGTGQFPKFKDEAFCLTDNKWLISTGEISLVNMFRNCVFEKSELPKLCMTYSPCFRSEAGAAGKDTKGLIRLHQFHKIELVTICTPDQATAMHEKKLETAKSILNLLQLPYRVLLLCGGDTGFSAAKQYDVEVWLPGMQRWLEIASCSQCATFQATRANIKYKNNEKLEFVHTLNGSALPIERLIAAIIENYYQEDGSILIPQTLLPWMNNQQRILITDQLV